MKNKGKILAIDFGAYFVGLAVTDEDRLLTFTRGVIKNYKSLENLFAKILELCKKEKVTQIVLGVPFASDGGKTAQSERMYAIGGKLQKYLQNIPVAFEDESFTSYAADDFLKSVGVKEGKRKDTEDEVAAIFILRRYLDRLEKAT